MENKQVTEQVKENKMGTMPVGKLLATMATPMILSMLVQAMYNVVDSIYVSRVSENALTAVSLAFPLQNLIIAVSCGLAVGVNSLLSRSLGSKDYAEVQSSARNGIFLSLIGTICFVLFGIFGSRAFFVTQTDIPEIVEYGTAYIQICTIASFGIFGEVMFERILQATGRTIYTLFTQGIGAILNIILDPIFIFGWLGMPEMGVAGAALATVIGQIVAFILAIYFNLKKNSDVKLSFQKFRPSWATIKPILLVGLPSMVMMAIGSVMTYGMNQILLRFTSTAVAVFGVYFKLQSFIFMPVFGLNNGMVPIIAYNYGACHKDRITKTIRISVATAVVFMLIGFAAFQLGPQVLLGFFDASDAMLEIGAYALRVISLSFLLAGFSVVAGSVFQALGNGLFSLIISVARQLIVLLPVAYLLSLTGNLHLVWFSFPIAELMSVLLSALFMGRIYRTKIKPLELQSAPAPIPE